MAGTIMSSHMILCTFAPSAWQQIVLSKIGVLQVTFPWHNVFLSAEQKEEKNLTAVHHTADTTISGNSDVGMVMNNYERIMCVISSSEALVVFCADKPNSSYLISEIQK